MEPNQINDLGNLLEICKINVDKELIKNILYSRL